MHKKELVIFFVNDQLAVDDEVEVRFGFFYFPFLIDETDEDFGCFGALFIRILFDGGHGRGFEVVGDREVGVADEAEVFVDL